MKSSSKGKILQKCIIKTYLSTILSTFLPYVYLVTRSIVRACKVIGVHLQLLTEVKKKIRKRRQSLFSRPARVENRRSTVATSTVPTFCICNGPDIGLMIYCENVNCQIKWFHVECMKIIKIPEGDWFCPQCQ